MEQFQRKRIPPLDNPGMLSQEDILSFIPDMNNDWPIIIETSKDTIQTSKNTVQTSEVVKGELQFTTKSRPNTTSNYPSHMIMGYSNLINRFFERNDIEETVWQIEQLRNREFWDYLGVIPTTFKDKKLTINGIQETLKSLESQRSKQSVIIYVVSRINQLELILVPPVGKAFRYQIPEAKRELLRSVVNEFRSQITKPTKRQTTSYLASAQLLYKWIIAPMETDLKRLGVNTLLFSLDPGLRSLPIAALHDGKHFLIEKYSFSLIPSFSLTNTGYSSVKDAKVLAMGRSQFSEQAPLPAVPMELQTIASLRHSESFLNNNFTLNNLEKERSSKAFRIVHLATHAQFNSGNPSNSYIQLWDSKLTLEQVKTLNWNNPPVDLLVLSACNTALGDRDAELGFTGLAIQSGAKAVLGSLWSVSDEGTLGLMSEFYQHLRTSSIKADALREAQITMLSGKVKLHNGRLITSQGAIPLPPDLPLNENINLTHPYYWSGFTLVGNPW
jgi:CHAT domain-containing protein